MELTDAADTVPPSARKKRLNEVALPTSDALEPVCTARFERGIPIPIPKLRVIVAKTNSRNGQSVLRKDRYIRAVAMTMQESIEILRRCPVFEMVTPATALPRIRARTIGTSMSPESILSVPKTLFI